MTKAKYITTDVARLLEPGTMMRCGCESNFEHAACLGQMQRCIADGIIKVVDGLGDAHYAHVRVMPDGAKVPGTAIVHRDHLPIAWTEDPAEKAGKAGKAGKAAGMIKTPDAESIRDESLRLCHEHFGENIDPNGETVRLVTNLALAMNGNGIAQIVGGLDLAGTKQSCDYCGGTGVGQLGMRCYAEGCTANGQC